MTDHFNQFANYIQQSILDQTAINKRASTITYWSSVAYNFYMIFNFHGLFMVISALTHPSITRLIQTQKIADRLLETMNISIQKLITICDISNDFANYRIEIQRAKLPSIPYIGCVQKDLIYTQESFPNNYQNTDLINFSKCRKCFDLIKEVEKCQNQRYGYAEDERFQNLITNLPPQKELLDLMKKSQELEPRDPNDGHRRSTLLSFFQSK